MRILGIDPGLRTTGWGVIDLGGVGSNSAHALSYVASGTISTVSLETKNLPIRLKMLFDGIQEICKTYQPDVSAIEIVFVNTGLVSCDIPVAEYTALQLKQAVVGYGRAAKNQVQEMVMRLLKLPGLPGPDAADALGVAITHAHSKPKMQNLLRRS
jgi:crossover junction endodeoxyribonuclease RuvC